MSFSRHIGFASIRGQRGAEGAQTRMPRHLTTLLSFCLLILGLLGVPPRAWAQPAAPTLTFTTPASGQVGLAWSTVAGATSYQIFRTSGSSYSPTPNYTVLAPATSYTDSGLINGASYSYVVKAANAAGTSPNSNQITAIPRAAVANVTNTSDSGTGSLRAAITAANATPGTIIAFRITSSAVGNVWTIKPTSALPLLTADQTRIDGSTQTSFGGNTNTVGPEVVINGSLAGSSVSGLSIGSSNCIVRDLIINGFSASGIEFNAYEDTEYTVPQNNTVAGCYLGTDITGTSAVPNANGITLDNADYTLIGGINASVRNIISGNSYSGIGFAASCSHNLIQGNYIGTDRTGTVQLGNHWYGINIVYSGGTYDGQDLIGGSATGARNVISGNWDTNIYVEVSRDLLIQNNNIGTDVTGNATLTPQVSAPPQGTGIYIRSTLAPVTIGGTSASLRNVIGDHYEAGIHLQDSSLVTIQGNYIGLGRDGSSDVGNFGFGIVSDNAVTTQIGGTVAGSGNSIQNNNQTGISISYTGLYPDQAQVSVRGNSIYANNRLGIDLNNNGVTANDSLDPDTGPNNYQNFPVISSAVSNGSGSTVTGTLNSNASRTIALDFFSTPVPNSSGYGDGRVYLGTKSVTTNASGNASFTYTGPAVTVGQYVTATATSNIGTSEFSLAVQCASALKAPSKPSAKID